MKKEMISINIMDIVERLKERLNSGLYLLFNKGRFRQIGHTVRIYSPLRMKGLENMSIGDDVRIANLSWIEALPLTGEECVLTIKTGVRIGHFNHIYCTKSITIEEDVLTADKVYISDNAHQYQDITLPIVKQPIKQLKEVVIGQGSWLGENVCVIGASVGKHCVIGANSVVTHDIPDFSVAVGAPARVIKRYSSEEKSGNEKL